MFIVYFLYFLVIAAIIGCAYTMQRALDEGNVKGALIFGFLALLNTILAIMMIVAEEVTILDTYLEQKEEILSLELEGSYGGRFFLGTGRIGEEHYYYMYIKEGEGYTLHKVKAEGVTIIFDDEMAPGIYKKVEVKEIIHLKEYKTTRKREEKKLYIVIPEGSLKEEFKPNIGD